MSLHSCIRLGFSVYQQSPIIVDVITFAPSLSVNFFFSNLSCFLLRIPTTQKTQLLHIQCEWLLYYCVVSPFMFLVPTKEEKEKSSFFLFFFLFILIPSDVAIAWRRSAVFPIFPFFLTSALYLCTTGSLLTRFRHFQ